MYDPKQADAYFAETADTDTDIVDVEEITPAEIYQAGVVAGRLPVAGLHRRYEAAMQVLAGRAHVEILGYTFRRAPAPPTGGRSWDDVDYVIDVVAMSGDGVWSGRKVGALMRTGWHLTGGGRVTDGLRHAAERVLVSTTDHDGEGRTEFAWRRRGGPGGPPVPAGEQEGTRFLWLDDLFAAAARRLRRDLTVRLLLAAHGVVADQPLMPDLAVGERAGDSSHLLGSGDHHKERALPRAGVDGKLASTLARAGSRVSAAREHAERRYLDGLPPHVRAVEEKALRSDKL